MSIFQRAHTRLAIWLSYWVCLFVSTHIPLPEKILSGHHADKVAHFVAYFVLTLFGGWWLRAGHSIRRITLVWLAAVFLAYGAFDETTQPFVGRSMTLGDWAADALGVMIGMGLLWKLAGRRLSDVHHDIETDA